MSAPFEFVGYKIAKIAYDVVAANKDKKEDEMTIENVIRLDRNNDDPTIFRLQLNVNVQGMKNICLELIGLFVWKIEYIEKETENSLISFGTTILYPYARSAVSAISILDGGDPIILPTINPFHMDDESKEKDSIIAEAQLK